MADITIFLAFAAGFLSFFSPCILPVIPGYMAFITGGAGKKSRASIMLYTGLFILGFSLVFSIIGLAINSSAGYLTYGTRIWLERIAGIFIIGFSLHMLGILKIGKLMEEHRFSPKRFSNKGLTAFIFGSAFAVGWSPCIGPILGSILALAVANPGMAFPLLFAYSLGLGIPFFAIGLSGERIMALFHKSKKMLSYYNIVMGLVLLILGLLVFTDNINLIGNMVALYLPK
ncbi:MAG: cytochrome c biogenesis protein CcdA [Nanoarchaeota archaeon]|nr:cytochrome c biogenesis protein CcdA [Nanoarchaeota archaeon]